MESLECLGRMYHVSPCTVIIAGWLVTLRRSRLCNVELENVLNMSSDAAKKN